MVCRENPASSIAIALARSGSWLDDAQVQSIVHQLRHEFSGSQPPAGWNRATFLARELDRAETAITINPNFRRDRRAGLLRRLQRARQESDGLPGEHSLGDDAPTRWCRRGTGRPRRPARRDRWAAGHESPGSTSAIPGAPRAGASRPTSQGYRRRTPRSRGDPVRPGDQACAPHPERRGSGPASGTARAAVDPTYRRHVWDRQRHPHRPVQPVGSRSRSDAGMAASPPTA